MRKFDCFRTRRLFASRDCPRQRRLRRRAPLVVAISVDQFSADLFDEYRGAVHRRAGAARREGIVFRNGYQSHAATETCPGHSTILTGDHPARTGIIANDWSTCRQRARENSDLLRGGREQAGTRDAYVVSAVHLRVATLGDRLKAANPRSQRSR